MSQILSTLEKLSKSSNFNQIINNKLIGIEKESLRLQLNGLLANNYHPKILGSKLTNSYITTDYSESQLELVTKAYNNADKALSELQDIHQFINHHLGSKELIWPYSMPGNIPKPKDIPIATFGNTAQSKFKEIYRMGLSYRYGKTMQLICGNHFNFSFSKEFWDVYCNIILDINSADQNTINQYYMHTVRNYMRYSWIVLYLFGASPAISSKLINTDTATAHYLKLLNKTTFLSPYGTSLRESSLGYHNKNNLDLEIFYNNIEDYANSLYKAITTVDPDFEAIGKYRRNKQIQLSCNKLQIENEYYGIIRPKPTADSKNMPVYKSLINNGIDYIELRNIDLNPFNLVGISLEQCNFLECLIYYCLLQDSPNFTDIERAHINNNHEKVALLGRQPNLQLKNQQQEIISLSNWAENIFKDLTIIAEYLDKANNNKLYTQAINYYKKFIGNPSLTFSGKIYDFLKSENLNYIDYFLNIAKEHDFIYKNSEHLSQEKLDYYNNIASKSLEEQARLEAVENSNNIEEIMAEYYG